MTNPLIRESVDGTKAKDDDVTLSVREHPQSRIFLLENLKKKIKTKD